MKDRLTTLYFLQWRFCHRVEKLLAWMKGWRLWFWIVDVRTSISSVFVWLFVDFKQNSVKWRKSSALMTEKTSYLRDLCKGEAGNWIEVVRLTTIKSPGPWNGFGSRKGCFWHVLQLGGSSLQLHVSAWRVCSNASCIHAVRCKGSFLVYRFFIICWVV